METNEPMTQQQSHDEQPSGRWSNFATWGAAHPTRIGMIAGDLVLGVAMFVAFALLRVGFQHDRHSDLRAAADREYITNVSLYTGKVVTYKLCLDNVRRYDLNHGQWQIIEDAFKDAADNGSASAQGIYDLIASGPLMTAPPVTADQCADPGDPPEEPNP